MAGSRQKLRCNRCGQFLNPETDPKSRGQYPGDRCSHEAVGYMGCTWSCGGQMRMWEETYNLYDRVTHPDIYYGREIFTVVEVHTDHIRVKGDFSGVGHPDQTALYLKDGWVIHSRVYWRQVIPDEVVKS